MIWWAIVSVLSQTKIVWLEKRNAEFHIL